MVFLLIRSTDKKRVRLLNGELTPVFEYHSQARHYAEGKGMFNCEVKESG